MMSRITMRLQKVMKSKNRRKKSRKMNDYVNLYYELIIMYRGILSYSWLDYLSPSWSLVSVVWQNTFALPTTFNNHSAFSLPFPFIFPSALIFHLLLSSVSYRSHCVGNLYNLSSRVFLFPFFAMEISKMAWTFSNCFKFQG